MEEFPPQGTGSLRPYWPGQPTTTTVGGQGTSIQEFYPVLCQVGLGHISRRDIFKDDHACLLA